MSAANNGDVREALDRVGDEVGKVVVGQQAAVKALVAALLVRGHVILEGVPGVAKTLLAKALSAAMDLDFRRIQFTPDLMPSDVTGNLVFDVDDADFHFRPGPVFTNLLLADEINRTPPKTQAALLEAMEERQVSVEGDTHRLPVPFIVVATQNPIELEGTYPLPEAQLDRFLLNIEIGYPGRDDERRVLRMHDEGMDPHDLAGAGVSAVAGNAHLDSGRAAVGAVTVSAEVLDYLLDLADATRQSPSIRLGVSPRGVTMLLHVAKAWAWLAGRDFVTPDDVKELVAPAWRHRIILRPEAELEGTTANRVLDGVVARTDVPK